MQKSRKNLISLLIIFAIFSTPAYSEENQEGQSAVVAQQAILSYKAGDYENTIKYFKMLGLDYLKMDDYILLANSYESLGNVQAAEKVLETLILKFPTDYQGYYNLGRLYYADGNFDKAILYFKKSLGQNPKYGPTYYNIGNSYYCLKKYKKAISYYKKTLKIMPEAKEAQENINLSLKMYKNSKFFF